MTRLPNLPSPARCCGCGACRAICPKGAVTMQGDQEGFLQPRVDATQCVLCGLCESICPVLHPGKSRPALSVYAARAKDDEIRRGSASGGIFTVLAQETLKRGGIVFGAGFEGSTWRVVHKAVTNEEELDELRGSKYVQSDTGNTFKEAKTWLDAGREVLYSGCPCQISALSRFLGRDYPNLTTVDLICHGVPSPLAWRKYLACREDEAGAEISKILPRRYCKREDFSISLKFGNAEEVGYSRTRETDSYIRSFVRFWGLRESCYSCQFRSLSTPSDFTLGDCNIAEDCFDAATGEEGISALIIRTKSGAERYDAIRGLIDSRPLAFLRLAKTNLALVKDEPRPRLRDVYRIELNEFKFDELVSRLAVRRNVSLPRYLAWWVKRLVINREINPFDPH